MIRKRVHAAATQSTTRLEAFTDGVFAIAATLLVLDLTQHSLGEVGSDAEMWSAVGGMWELFLNFALSFLLLCLMWMVHVQQFEHVARVDATMVWLNNARLLFIVLVPFARSADDHQKKNAEEMQAAGAAVMVEESGLTAETLARSVGALLEMVATFVTTTTALSVTPTPMSEDKIGMPAASSDPKVTARIT